MTLSVYFNKVERTNLLTYCKKINKRPTVFVKEIVRDWLKQAEEKNTTDKDKSYGQKV